MCRFHNIFLQTGAGQPYLQSWIMVRLCESYSSAGATVVAEYAKSLGKVRENPYEDPDGARPVHVFM